MKFSARFILIAVSALIFTLAFSDISEAKKIKITRDEAAALVNKFRAANPQIAITDRLTDCKAPGHDEKFHKSLVVNIKKWEILNQRADDAASAADKREKARENSAKLVEKIAQACAEESAKPLPVEVKKEVPAKAPDAAEAVKPAEKPAVKAASKREKKESEPEKFQPKTERGQKIKDMILGNKK